MASLALIIFNFRNVEIPVNFIFLKEENFVKKNK
jgi:hypothetical protein